MYISCYPLYINISFVQVHVYDVREDIRQLEYVPGRSINLAMSVRALSALNKVGLDQHMKQEYGIPMYARMIHNKDGAMHGIPYGKENECIYSVGRRYVNEILLDKGETYENITYHFNHKLVKADLEKPELIFQRTDVQEDTKVQQDSYFKSLDSNFHHHTINVTKFYP